MIKYLAVAYCGFGDMISPQGYYSNKEEAEKAQKRIKENFNSWVVSIVDIPN